MFRYPLLLLLLLTTSISFSQTKLYILNGCAVNKCERGAEHYVSEPDEEARLLIEAIMEANMLKPNFIIRAGDVENALATLDKNQRFIIYNTAYLERMKNDQDTDWAAFFIFAHEAGHHLSKHRFNFRDDARQKRQEELQADIFAGSMLYRLGATLEEAQLSVGAVVNEEESNSHPSKKARMEAIANGWKKAKGANTGLTDRFVPPVCSTASPITDPLGLLLVNGGTFTMGCNSEEQDCLKNENPPHQVTVSDFYLDKYEMTQQRWQEIMGTKPVGIPNCDQCPVHQVNWQDVQEFLEKLNKKYPGYNYRLPTEAEWEYAAREGGKALLFGNGKNILDPAEANFLAYTQYTTSYSVAGVSRWKPTPVGSFSPNTLGFYDMSGNAWEWCSDWFGWDYYKNSPEQNPAGPEDGSSRVLRGGAYNCSPVYCRVTHRNSGSLSYRNYSVGFRLARNK